MTQALTPSTELADHTRQVYAAMQAGDPQAVEALYSLAPGSVFIGSDTAEFWTDSAQHNQDVRPYWQPGSMVIEPGEITACEMGDAGFTVDRPRISAAGRTWELRISLVWHRESDGMWRVVHSHASVGQD